MNKIEEIRVQLKRIHNQIVNLLDQEQMKAADIPDIGISTSEEANTILNNIDLLYAALRGVDSAEYVLADYKEAAEQLSPA